MIDSLANMWSKNKFLFFLLLPLVILAIGVKFYSEYQVMQAKESLKETEKTHEELDKEKRRAQKAAEKAKAKQEALAKRRIENGIDEIPEDWHKNSD